MFEGLAKTEGRPVRIQNRTGCSHPPDNEPVALSPQAVERMEWALSACEKLRLRITDARRAILRCFAEHDTPLTLAQIGKESNVMGRFDAATVYRTVILLSDAEIVRQISVDHKLRYFTLNSPGETCAYLICHCCGEVTPLKQSSIEEARVLEAVELGYSNLDHLLEIRGLCRRCRMTPGVSDPIFKLRIRPAFPSK